MEARYMTDLEWRICHAVNIYLYRNGSDGEAPLLVHIPPGKKKNMKSIMNVIQERVRFPVGFAAYIYKMDGKRVRHPCELEMYNNYVVASNYDKHFKCAQYGRKRSPLIVLNRESKHIRVLRQQHQNFYEWSLKKKGGEERPQHIYPTYDNSRQQTTAGQMDSFGQPGSRAGYPSQGQQGARGQPSQKQMYEPPRNGYKEYSTNTCLVNFNNNHSMQQVLKATQVFSKVFKVQENVGDTVPHTNWSKAKHPEALHKSGQVKVRVADINGNTDEDDRDFVDENENYISDDSKRSRSDSSGSESIMETDSLGAKYQEMLKEFKRKLKRQALIDAQSSLSSIKVSLSRHQLRSRKLPKSRSRVVTNDEIIVLPPPPLEFRDGIIPRRGTFYSYNPLH